MWETAESELAKVRDLVLRPTPTHLAELVRTLETLASQVAAMKTTVAAQGICDPETAAQLRRLQAEMLSTKRLLSSAATFFNGLALLRKADSTGYERTGLLCSAASSGRVLAQL